MFGARGPAASSSSSAPSAFAATLNAPLNAGQAAVLKRALEGRSIFITGAAGTGKSFLLKRIIAELRARYPETAVAVTASTGIAATHIDGQTLHSFAGVGLAKEPPDVLAQMVGKNKAATKRWRDLRTLIIDEVSMLNGDFLTKLEAVSRATRMDQRAFGGVQLLVVGDFLQLPPVMMTGGFAFESPAWAAAGVETFVLTEVVRQAGDARFTALLNEIRVGRLSPASAAILATCVVGAAGSGKPRPTDGIKPTQLFCINKDVEKINADELRKLGGESRVFEAVDEFVRRPSPSGEAKVLLEVEKKAPLRLELKVGAQVTMTKNMPAVRLVNGSRGIVTALAGGSGATAGPVVRFDNGVEMPVQVFASHQLNTLSPSSLTLVPTLPDVYCSGVEKVYYGGPEGSVNRKQLPLKLAWALTIHKSQGMTLSRAEVDMTGSFENGHSYVALSRVVSLDGLWLTSPVTQRNVMANRKILDFYRL
jgi:ATP-dependent DNA helicase PIF1